MKLKKSLSIWAAIAAITAIAAVACGYFLGGLGILLYHFYSGKGILETYYMMKDYLSPSSYEAGEYEADYYE